VGDRYQTFFCNRAFHALFPLFPAFPGHPDGMPIEPFNTAARLSG
jgi:hypothetical protein